MVIVLIEQIPVKPATMPRNIQTTIPKWGKTLDVYFDSNFIKQDKLILEKNKKISLKENLINFRIEISIFRVHFNKNNVLLKKTTIHTFS